MSYSCDQFIDGHCAPYWCTLTQPCVVWVNFGGCGTNSTHTFGILFPEKANNIAETATWSNQFIYYDNAGSWTQHPAGRAAVGVTWDPAVRSVTIQTSTAWSVPNNQRLTIKYDNGTDWTSKAPSGPNSAVTCP